VTTRAIAAVLAVIDVRFMYWLVIQSRHPRLTGWLWPWTLHAAAVDGYLLLLAGLALGSIAMQLFLLMNVLTISRACLAARDPVPVEPDPSLRVAFLTTLVPEKEPVEMAERTLRAATRIVYDGPFDVWLLDEGDSARSSGCARGSACVTSAARGAGTPSPTPASSPARPSTAITTGGCGSTPATTT
jgi:hypothetical protein